MPSNTEALLAAQLTEERHAHAQTRRAYEALVQTLADLKREGFGLAKDLPAPTPEPDPLGATVLRAIGARATTIGEQAQLRKQAEEMLAVGESVEVGVSRILEGEPVDA